MYHYLCIFIIFLYSQIAAEIFGAGTGISDDEINAVLRIQVSSKILQDLDTQIAAQHKVIKVLKNILLAITKGKNDFIVRAIEAKRGLRYSHLKKLGDEIFAPGTGISDDEIRKVMRLKISSKKMGLDQQVAAGNKIIKRLTDTSTATMIGKNKFVIRAIAAEKSYRIGKTKVRRATRTSSFVNVDDVMMGSMREFSLTEKEIQNLQEFAGGQEMLSEADTFGSHNNSVQVNIIEEEKRHLQEKLDSVTNGVKELHKEFSLIDSRKNTDRKVKTSFSV
jgi:hypothetical protein